MGIGVCHIRKYVGFPRCIGQSGTLRHLVFCQVRPRRRHRRHRVLRNSLPRFGCAFQMSPWWLLFVALQSGLLLVLFMVNLCQCDAWVSMVLRACVPARTFPRWRSRTIRETSMNRALIDPRALHIDVSSTSESVLTDD